MATTIRKAVYFSLHTANRAGQGARMLKALRDEDVDLLAFTGFPNAGRAQVDFIPVDTGKFLRAARKLGLKVGKRKTVFIAQGDDKPGAIGGVHTEISSLANGCGHGHLLW